MDTEPDQQKLKPLKKQPDVGDAEQLEQEFDNKLKELEGKRAGRGDY